MGYHRDFFVVDQCFLIFYVIELGLRAVYKRRQLLFGKCWDVWANWLDLFIVIVGVLDQWLLPLVAQSTNHSTLFSNTVRCLRLARLARLIKVLNACYKADVTWIRFPAFQGFMMCVICLNAVVMGLEVDYPFIPVWFWLEQGMLSIFVFEIRVFVELARLRYRRRRLRGSVAAAVHQHLGDASRISGAFHGQSGAVDDGSENFPFAPHPAARPFDQGMQGSLESGDGRRGCLQGHGMGPAPLVCSYLHSGPPQREADRRGATHGWCTTRGGKGSVFICVRGVLDLLPCREWRVRTFGRHAPGVSLVQDSHHGLCHHLQLGTSLYPYVCRL